MTFPGGRISGDITPSNTGQDLGDTTHRWDAYLNDLHVNGSVDLNGAALTGNLTGNVTGNLTGNADTATLAASATKSAQRDKGYVNVMTDYSTVVGDGVTDDGPAIQAILDANPSKWIFFPTMSWSASGSTPTSYLSNQRLVMNGNGQVLFGPTPVKRLGGTKIKFASGIGGVSMPSTYNNQGVANLFLEGSDLANSSVTTTYEGAYKSIATVTNLSTSGIEISGSSSWVEGCRISSFKGHGIEVYGASGGQPDYWNISKCYLDFNRGFGLFVTGTDANVGKAQHLSIEGNLLGGIYDAAFYGNTYDQTHTTQNARNGVAAGSNKTIAAANGIVVSGGTATITTTAAHGWSVNQWITSTGSTDATYNETARILTVPTSTSATYATLHADGNTANGTAATSSGTQILAYYTSVGIATGPFSTHATAGGTLLLTPYSESNQTAAVYNPNTITINQQGTAITGATTGHHMYGAAGPIWFFTGGHWVFQPLIAGDQLIVRNLAGDTNMFTVDVSGNIVSKGSTFTFGASNPATAGFWRVANAFTMYARNNANTVNHRIMLFHTDDNLYLGESTGNTQTQGAWTTTGGLKIGSGGTSLTQTKVYSQSLTPASTNAATSAEQTFTVSGLTTADKVFINPPALANACAPVACRVTAADTLGITFMNPTAGSLTSSSGTYLITAIRS